MLKMKLVIHHFVSDSGFYNLPLPRIITDYIFTPSKDILDPMLTLELKGRPLNFKIVDSQLAMNSKNSCSHSVCPNITSMVTVARSVFLNSTVLTDAILSYFFIFPPFLAGLPHTSL